MSLRSALGYVQVALSGRFLTAESQRVFLQPKSREFSCSRNPWRFLATEIYGVALLQKSMASPCCRNLWRCLAARFWALTSKYPIAIFLHGDIYIATFGAHKVEKIGEGDVHIEQHGVAYENEIKTGTGESHVQLAVDYHAVLLKHVVGEEVELIGLLDGETINDEVALTALITLHCVDGDVVQARDAISVYLVAHG